MFRKAALATVDTDRSVRCVPRQLGHVRKPPRFQRGPQADEGTRTLDLLGGILGPGQPESVGTGGNGSWYRAASCAPPGPHRAWACPPKRSQVLLSALSVPGAPARREPAQPSRLSASVISSSLAQCACHGASARISASSKRSNQRCRSRCRAARATSCSPSRARPSATSLPGAEEPPATAAGADDDGDAVRGR